MMTSFFCIITEIDHTIFNLFHLTDFWVNPQIHVQVFPIYYSSIGLSNVLPLVAVTRVFWEG